MDNLKSSSVWLDSFVQDLPLQGIVRLNGNHNVPLQSTLRTAEEGYHVDSTSSAGLREPGPVGQAFYVADLQLPFLQRGLMFKCQPVCVIFVSVTSLCDIVVMM